MRYHRLGLASQVGATRNRNPNPHEAESMADRAKITIGGQHRLASLLKNQSWLQPHRS